MNDKSLSLDDLKREQTVLEILRYMLVEKKDDGRYSLKEACQKAGIAPATWYKWVEDGIVNGPLQTISNSISQMAYDIIIPNYQDVILTQVYLASGKIPPGSDITSVSGADARGAFKLLQQIVPARNIEDAPSSHRQELEHAETYTPKQLYVNVEGDFVYSGGEEASFGNLPSLKDEIEGEAVEVK